MQNHFQQKLTRAIHSFQAGNVEEADRFALEALAINPKSPDALHLRGVVAGLQNRHADAELFLRKAAEIEKKNHYIFFNLAKSLSEQEKDKESLKWHRKALELDSRHDKAWLNYGKSLFNLGEIDAAISAFDRALAINQNLAEGYSNKANCLQERKDYEEALTLYDHAIKLNSNLAQAWSYRGVALKDLKRYEEALASYERSIELKPDYAEAWNNRGVALKDLKRYEEALASYERSIELKPDYAEAWCNRGVALNDLDRHEEALASYERAIELNPDIDFMLGDLMHSQMKVCAWDKLEQRRQTLEENLLTGGKASTPLPVLGLFDNPDFQKRCAEIYARDTFSLGGRLGVLAQRPKRNKIRIGYFSMDFREHPVSNLTIELFELHDRSKFEIYGFSFGANSHDSMRQRVEKAFDKFLDVKNLGVFDIAILSRQHEIDIAIDLGGHTQDSRPQIFSARVAPIQINYLGYPGTWGSDCMDYFIGDKITVPDENIAHFSEKIVFLPNSFQVNPSHRPIVSSKPSSQDHGLPKDSFVFCCFNNSWKITPELFGQWMQVLQEVQNSVLWLYAGNLSSETNLRSEAVKHGVLVDRIIFAKQVPRDAYLAQFQHADLFLDTLPYNAGTTASDAIWAGLPVLTQIGKSFASRMAASLLTTIGAPELITHSKEEYCSLAIELASNPKRLAAIKAKLTQNRRTTPLFDTKLFAKHIEAAYQAAYDRYHAGLPPDHIDVDP
jgi:protein O-GlcNAc transferase